MVALPEVEAARVPCVGFVAAACAVDVTPVPSNAAGVEVELTGPGALVPELHAASRVMSKPVMATRERLRNICGCYRPWQCLNLRPLPQKHGSLRPIFALLMPAATGAGPADFWPERACCCCPFRPFGLPAGALPSPVGAG